MQQGKSRNPERSLWPTVQSYKNSLNTPVGLMKVGVSFLSAKTMWRRRKEKVEFDAHPMALIISSREAPPSVTMEAEIPVSSRSGRDMSGTDDPITEHLITDENNQQHGLWMVSRQWHWCFFSQLCCQWNIHGGTSPQCNTMEAEIPLRSCSGWDMSGVALYINENNQLQGLWRVSQTVALMFFSLLCSCETSREASRCNDHI